MAKDYNIELFFPSHEYIIENSYIYSWECDIFIQMKSGYHYEIEQKVSRSDFRADFKKSAKHFQLKNHKKDELTIPGGKYTQFISNEQVDKFDYDVSELKLKKRRLYTGKEGYEFWLYSKISRRINKIPNRFYYITPKGLLDPKEVPFYAGLLEYENGEIKQVKTSKWLHKNKYNYDKILLDKYKWRINDLRTECRMLRAELNRFNSIYDNPNIEYYQDEINF